jgi:hypothetical protein
MNAPLMVFLGSLFFVGSSLAEPRIFTNKEGKALTAELIHVEDENAVLKLANTRQVKIPLDSLTETDQEFIKSWWKENKNNVTEMDLRLAIEKKTRRISNTDRVKTKGKKGEAQKIATVAKVEYSCVLNSFTRRDLSDITADYTIYKNISTRGKDGSGTTTETTDGSATVATLLSNQSATFETTDVTCEDSSQKASKKAPATSKRETVVGIVVRLSANGKEFLQQSHPENFIERLQEKEEREARE